MNLDQPAPFMTTHCPVCQAEIPVTVAVIVDTDGALVLDPDLTDAWVHAWTHDTTRNEV